jgi:very-short-patch-repair endonuclease
MKSQLHKDVYLIIKDIYPNEQIIEEKTVKIGKQSLFIDIYIPKLKIAIECDGIQHEKFNKFFHQDIFAFASQKRNDEQKEIYCQDNGITLVRIKHNDKLDRQTVYEKIINKLKES